MARDFTVFTVTNGWVVSVGCSTFAYVSQAELEKDISDYLADPDKKERQMREKFMKPTKNFNGPEIAKQPSVESCSGAGEGPRNAAPSADFDRALRR